MQLAVEIRFYRIIAAAWRHRYLLVIPPIVMPLVGLVIGMMSPRVYDSHTSFLIQESAKLNPFLKDLSVETHIQQRIKALETLLHSRHILQQVAEEQKLYSEEAKQAEKDWVVRKLSSRLSVSLFGSDLVRIQYRSPEKGNMAPILSNVREVFINQLLAPERSSVSNSEKFLLEQLERQRELLNQSEQDLSVFKAEFALQLPGLMNNNITEISELKRQIAEKETELAGQAAVLETLHTQLLRNNPVLASLEKDIIRLKSDLVSLQARYTDQHSKVISANNQLQRLQDERRELISLTESINSIDELERLWQASGTALPSHTSPEHILSGQGTIVMAQLEEAESARARHQRIEHELGQLKKQLNQVLALVNNSGDIEQTLLRLNRDLDVQRKVYSELLDRYERAKITGALGSYEQRDRIKIIDKAFEPSVPSNLPVVVFVAAGLVAGIGLGSGIALLIELTDSRLRYIEDVQKSAGVPVLTRIPLVKENSYVLDLSEFDLDEITDSDTTNNNQPPAIEGELQ
ncbi:GumC family protein [Oceanospirillum sediminis]|uniref:Chain-length determining protein n=1 Tax=Oceanospirillum sediminis TaxID=2760088 RepID=A0A839IRN2_9GAMM|nr:GNVR domain-containing protein [Oceanospirillum sediminis]MBB1487340.1 chain-length determining protein [Oceanospirillum sediminis]